MSHYCFGFAILFNIFVSYIFPQLSWAGSVGADSTNGNSNPADNSQVSAAPNPETSTSEISTSATSNITPQQTGIVQFNNSGYNTLTYPNCGGVCAFGIVRLTPGGNGTTNQEAVMGVVMQFDSPEKRYAQAQENLSKAQSDRIIQEDEVSLLTKLADAIEQCKDAHANLLAISAAKRLGITAEEILSRAYKQPQQCNSHLGN